MMKTYIKPTMQVVEVESNQQILAGLTTSVQTTGLEEKLRNDSPTHPLGERRVERRRRIRKKASPVGEALFFRLPWNHVSFIWAVCLAVFTELEDL